MPFNVRVPVPDLLSVCDPPITPPIVKTFELLTATPASELIPDPLKVKVVPLDPVNIPERVVVIELSVVSVELLVTLVAPEVVTFWVSCSVPFDKVNPAVDPPILLSEEIAKVPAEIVVPRV